MRLKYLVVILGLVLLVIAPQTFAQNLVQNGSFESGDFTGWSGDQLGMLVTSGGWDSYTGAQDGTYYAVMGAVGGDGTLTQAITDTAGASYKFSFWMAAQGDENSDFNVYWDGTLLLSLTNPDTGSQWTQFSYQVTGTGSDTIQFAVRDDPAYIAVDNVSVTPNTTAPEPGSLMLMGTGILALGGVVRRKLF
jgi:hypothetical protein